MTPNNRKVHLAASTGALFAATASCLQASGTVEVVTLVQQSGANYDVLFSNISNATELVSISSGTVNTGEFGTLTISAVFANDQVFQMYNSGPFGGFGDVNPLSFYTNNNFTPFASPSEVKGLRIAGTTGGASGAPPATLLLPAGTILTFAVIPEPATALLVVSALFLIAILRRRFNRTGAIAR